MQTECSVTCPTCFESFTILIPPHSEQPCQLDYDCEICCSPMLINISDQAAEAFRID